MKDCEIVESSEWLSGFGPDLSESCYCATRFEHCFSVMAENEILLKDLLSDQGMAIVVVAFFSAGHASPRGNLLANSSRGCKPTQRLDQSVAELSKSPAHKLHPTRLVWNVANVERAAS